MVLGLLDEEDEDRLLDFSRFGLVAEDFTAAIAFFLTDLECRLALSTTISAANVLSSSSSGCCSADRLDRLSKYSCNGVSNDLLFSLFVPTRCRC